MPTAKEIAHALADYFPAHDIGWKPQATSGNKALAIAYIDARNVMDRLDAVVGAENWQDTYHVLPDGNVVCTLELRISGEWISKCDVGGESDQKDEGDRCKAAFSDSLKRAAVKWGVGRYLYNLPSQWCDYDPQKRQFVRTPSLPSWALPSGKRPAPTPAPVQTSQPEQQPTPARELPKLTEANQKRLDQLKRDDERLSGQGLAKEHDLLREATRAAKATGCEARAETWTEAAWQAAMKAAENFALDCEGKRLATTAQLELLDALLLRKGRDVADVYAKFGLPKGAGLTASLCEQAMEMLEQMPDAEAAKKQRTARK